MFKYGEKEGCQSNHLKFKFAATGRHRADGTEPGVRVKQPQIGGPLPQLRRVVAKAEQAAAAAHVLHHGDAPEASGVGRVAQLELPARADGLGHRDAGSDGQAAIQGAVTLLLNVRAHCRVARVSG